MILTSGKEPSFVPVSYSRSHLVEEARFLVDEHVAAALDGQPDSTRAAIMTATSERIWNGSVSLHVLEVSIREAYEQAVPN